MRRRAVAVAVGVLAAGGIVLGVVLSLGSDGPPPLGNPATWGPGLECSPGTTLADGFYAIENHSDEAATITSVQLVGGSGLKMTGPALLVQWGPQYNHGLIGLVPWPMATDLPWWKYRRLAVGATIGPHSGANLVFSETRTDAHPQPAEPEFTYTADGSTYTVTERVQTIIVTGDCQQVLEAWRPPASYPS
jgi:hypothetical protein